MCASCENFPQHYFYNKLLGKFVAETVAGVAALQERKTPSGNLVIPTWSASATPTVDLSVKRHHRSGLPSLALHLQHQFSARSVSARYLNHSLSLSVRLHHSLKLMCQNYQSFHF